MEWRDLGMNEVVPRTAPARVVSFPAEPPFSTQDPEPDDLEIDPLSEAAAAVRRAEERAEEVTARTDNFIDHAMARIQSIEAARRNAEIEVAELSAAIADARRELELTRAQLAAKEKELVATEQRARIAEAAVDRIVDAIRSQLREVDERAGNNANAAA